ncbi:MAG: type IV secretion system protein IcmL [Chloroflexota bacterium]|nr:MAG: type IV secretion system protein IcmL [Chloroflexota bacterium]
MQATPRKGQARAGAQVLQVIENRVEFYRDGYRKWLQVSLIASSVALGSLILNGIQIYLRPDPVYFAIGQDGRLIPLVPLDQPLVNHDVVLQFAQRAAQKSFIFDFQNYNGQLTELRGLYTKTGYETLIASLEKNSVIDLVRTKRYVASAVATNAPALTWEGKDKGIYKWRVEMPMIITLQGQTERKDIPATVVVIVNRTPSIDTPNGIAVGALAVLPQEGK